MKVAYNSCYGGFSLSPIAETEYQNKKGVTLTWYKGNGVYPYDNFTRIADLESINARYSMFRLTASTKDLGKNIEKVPEDCYYYKSWHGEKDRSDPDLIEVIERLGDKANGSCAKLAIFEIPDGAEFEITEYDGNEGVEPPRQSW